VKVCAIGSTCQRSHPTTPVSRSLSPMRHSDDAQYVSIDPVNERKRKTTHRKSPVSSVDCLTDIRSIAEEFRDALRFCQQLTAKAGAALLTERHCRSELLLRCGVKLDLHFLSWE